MNRSHDRVPLARNGALPEAAGYARAAPVGARRMLDYWRKSEANWFCKDPAFDNAFRDAFLALHLSAAQRALDAWVEHPQGALALLLLLDQFPRNAFRGTPQMYATDTLARHYARLVLDAGHRARIPGDLKLFLCLPFAHAENLDDQDTSVSLNRELGEPWLTHAMGHRDIIRRFGRFPHRNAILGRIDTQEEKTFLAQGGFAG